MIIKGDLILRKCKNLVKLVDIDRIEGELILEDCSNFEDLGVLKSVGRSLNLVGCKNFKSLGDLKSVGGYLALEDGIKIADPENLEHIGELAYDITKPFPFKTLGTLKTIEQETLGYKETGSLEMGKNVIWNFQGYKSKYPHFIFFDWNKKDYEDGTFISKYKSRNLK